MNPVLVRGHVSKVLFGMRVVGVLVMLTGIILLSADRLAGILTLFPAVLVWVLTEARLAYLRRSRVWVTDQGHSFVVRDALGERTVDDDEIVSLDLETRNIYSQGVFKGVDRNFRVKVVGDRRPLTMENRIKVGEADPLAALISRNIEKYRQRADEALGAGATLSGNGWSISQGGFTPGPSLPMVPFDELEAVGQFDRHLCVWKRGSDEAITRIPVQSENAFLLQLLLTPRIPDRDEAGSQENQEGLGRVLFERKGARATKIVLWLLMLGLVGSGAVVMLMGIGQRDVGQSLVGMLLAGGGALCVLGIVEQSKAVFRCHERGVFKRGLFSETRLRYADVDSFSYSATRQYYNGVYIGTHLNMALTPRGGGSAKPVKFHQTVQNADDDLDELRNHIARILASRMLQQLAAGEPIRWTRHLTIRPEGIEYRPAGFVGRKDPVLLPFDRLYGFDIQQGTFHLWEKGKEKSVMQESVGEANFFPGYFALSLMYSRTSESQT